MLTSALKIPFSETGKIQLATRIRRIDVLGNESSESHHNNKAYNDYEFIPATKRPMQISRADRSYAEIEAMAPVQSRYHDFYRANYHILCDRG